MIGVVLCVYIHIGLGIGLPHFPLKFATEHLLYMVNCPLVGAYPFLENFVLFDLRETLPAVWNYLERSPGYVTQIYQREIAIPLANSISTCCV
jgi:hypothetical protein